MGWSLSDLMKCTRYEKQKMEDSSDVIRYLFLTSIIQVYILLPL